MSPPVMIRVGHVMSGMDELVRGGVGREVERSFRVVKAKVSSLWGFYRVVCVCVCGRELTDIGLVRHCACDGRELAREKP